MSLLEFTDIDLVIEDLEARARGLDEVETGDVLGGSRRGRRIARRRSQQRRRSSSRRRTHHRSNGRLYRPKPKYVTRGSSNSNYAKKKRSLLGKADFHKRKSNMYRHQANMLRP